MAIQKINLGSEPLGEGGDTYRSANTKINENFTNPDHAASRVVGTRAGQIPLAEDTFYTTFSYAGTNGDVPFADPSGDKTKEFVDNMNAGERMYKMQASGGLSGLPSVITIPTHNASHLYRGQLAFGYGSNNSLHYRSSRSRTDWTDWATFYSNRNTKKDSKTNLLLASEDTIPEDSAAIRLVGTTKGKVPLAEDISKVSLSQLGIKKMSEMGSTDITTSAYYGETVQITNSDGAIGLPPVLEESPATLLMTKRNLLYATQIAWSLSTATPRIFMRNRWGGWKSWAELYTTGNTKLDTNGALAPSSPTIDLYSDRIETNDDGSRMNPEFVRNGVGDYTIKNTTGLRDEGWYIKIPNDMNGNPKVAVTVDTDKDGNLSIKTYKRTFSLETFTFGPDLSEPLDVPEGRWIDLRFNDLPQEDIEEPVMEEELEPEAVEEPTVEEPEVVAEEEPVEESK